MASRSLSSRTLPHTTLQYPHSFCALKLPRPSLAPSARALTPTRSNRRHYASAKTPPDEPQLATLPNLDASKLTITKVTNPKPVTPPEELIFGRTFTDHMLSAEWTASEGWYPPQITPYKNLSLDPATSVLHYAFTAFEGTKAYKDKKGRVRLFRPEMNMARLNRSAKRIALPAFDSHNAIELMKRFCALEERHIPSTKGYSLYLRPTIIGTQRTLGVGPPASALWFLIASPVGPYYPTGFKAISLAATSSAVRAWPGGVGQYKLGANYAPCIVPQMEAATQGHHQNLWLFKDDSPEGGGEEFVSEVGTMNIFAAFQKKDGTKELVTPPLDGTILEGVTRDSIVELARERLTTEGWEVNERRMTMREMAEASREGRLLEVFGAGTAAVVAPVRRIAWRDQVLDCNLPPGEEAGELAKKFTDWVLGIQYGDEEHPWSVVV